MPRTGRARGGAGPAVRKAGGAAQVIVEQGGHGEHDVGAVCLAILAMRTRRFQMRQQGMPRNAAAQEYERPCDLHREAAMA